MLSSHARVTARPPQRIHYEVESQTLNTRCLRFRPRVAATPARLASGLLARLWPDQTFTGRLISASPNAPRSDPSMHDSRTRLPPWVSDGKSLIRPRMKNTRVREPTLSEPFCLLH